MRVMKILLGNNIVVKERRMFYGYDGFNENVKQQRKYGEDKC